MSENERPGFYKDAQGIWQKDRRQSTDRRGAAPGGPQHERRKFFRRKADREAYLRDNELIEDALNEFASEHNGHV